MAHASQSTPDTCESSPGSGIPAPESTRYYSIENDHYCACISSLGAGLQGLYFDGRPLVETYPQGEVAPLSAGLVLAPWPNRLADGEFAVGGTTFHLELTEQERHNALHGLVFDRQWDLVDHTRQAVSLAIAIGPDNGWPWSVTITATYELGDEGLEATFKASAADGDTADAAIPFVFGWHTYLQAQGAPTDECTLRVGVDQQLELDPQRKLPHGSPRTTELASLLAHGVCLAGVSLDDCFHASTGESVTTTFIDDTGRGVAMTCSPELSWYQVFTPGADIDIPFPGAPGGRAVAVEPMTGPPNALASGVDVTDLSAAPMRIKVQITALEPSH